MSREAALRLVGVSAGFGARHILSELSMEIGAGELVALIGPNGAGKTTLLNVATGAVKCNRGEVKLFDEALTDISPRKRARLMAMVSQTLETPMAYTVEELVMMGRTAHLGRWGAPGKRDREAVAEALALASVTKLRRRRYQTLSSGEQQRVAIAMALAAEPRLLLLDEATAHLDINHRLEVVSLVREISARKRIGVLAIVHDLNLAAEFFPRIILLDQGRIMADGKPEAVFKPDLLKKVYGCEVGVRLDEESGCLRIFPKG